MKSKSIVATICFAALGLCLAMYLSTTTGCNRTPKVTPPVAKTLTPQEIKEAVALLNGKFEKGPFGANIKAGAAEKLADLGQAAKDAGAIKELTKLSRDSKVEPVAREAAVAALAKLNAAAPATQ